MRTLSNINRATPQMRHFAKLLITHGAGKNRTSGTHPVAFVICAQLRPHLTNMMGQGGFRAVLSRALALATAEVPWLRAVRVNEDGGLEGGEEIQKQLDPDEFLEGRVVLVAQLLGLLVAFIGESLTLCLVRDIWPKVPLKDLDFDNEGKYEDSKKHAQTHPA